MTDRVVVDHFNYEGNQPIELCARCAALKINELWKNAGAERESLGIIQNWAVDTCMLCNFLFNLLPPEIVSESSNRYYLYSAKSRDTERLVQLLETRLLVLSTTDSGPPPKGIPYFTLHPAGQPPSWRKDIEPLIDFEQPRKWIKTCANLHANHCGGNTNNTVSNLRLIDCYTGEIKRAAEDEEYVALSYVWGQEGTTSKPSLAYPQTIQDAILATKQLGYSRLWIDQYCIDQTNQPEFQDQLQQMDSIYKQAVVTLVAAAGVNANHGLPGVSTRLRPPTPSVTINNQTLSPLTSTPNLNPQTSKWMSRAWTFQEGLLSTRRLIFTPTQLYFECRGMYSTELLSLPLETWRAMHHGEHPYLHARFRVAPHMGIFPLGGCGVDPRDIYSRIMEYSTRNLTHQIDILNGMLGIFRHFERNRNSIRHLYGIAYPTTSVSSPNETVAPEHGSKYKIPLFAESLQWSLKIPGTRREGFPSWSWTGWFGECAWPAAYLGSGGGGGGVGKSPPARRIPRKTERPHDPRVNERAMRVKVEMRDGTVLEWTRFQERYHEVSTFDMSSGILQLEAYVTPAVYVREGEGPTIDIRLRCENGEFLTVEAERTTARALEPQNPLLAVHFCRTVSRTPGKESDITKSPRGVVEVNQHLLILQKKGGSSHWERVALGTYVRDGQKQVECKWQALRVG